MRKMAEIDVRETLNSRLRRRAMHYVKIIVCFETTLIFAYRKYLKNIVIRKKLQYKSWSN